MRKTILPIFIITLCGLIYAQEPSKIGTKPILSPINFRQTRPLAIQNVTVILGTTNSQDEKSTVLIRDGRILLVGPTTEVKIPSDFQIIDGSGKFLIPGLIDMHTHLSKTRSSSLSLFIANGVTTVRDMGGDPEELLKWRKEV